MARGQFLERRAPDPLENLPEKDEAEIAIERPAARLVHQIHLEDPLHVGGAAFDLQM